MINGPQRLAPNTLKKPLRFRDHVLAEFVIRRDKKPGVLSLGYERSQRTGHQRVGIMKPGEAGFDALLAGERSGRDGGVNRNLFLSRMMVWRASPTAELPTSAIASTPSTSNHLRTIAEPISGLF